jgi:hypothetical protein
LTLSAVGFVPIHVEGLPDDSLVEYAVTTRGKVAFRFHKVREDAVGAVKRMHTKRKHRQYVCGTHTTRDALHVQPRVREDDNLDSVIEAIVKMVSGIVSAFYRPGAKNECSRRKSKQSKRFVNRDYHEKTRGYKSP